MPDPVDSATLRLLRAMSSEGGHDALPAPIIRLAELGVAERERYYQFFIEQDIQVCFVCDSGSDRDCGVQGKGEGRGGALACTVGSVLWRPATAPTAGGHARCFARRACAVLSKQSRRICCKHSVCAALCAGGAGAGRDQPQAQGERCTRRSCAACAHGLAMRDAGSSSSNSSRQERRRPARQHTRTWHLCGGGACPARPPRWRAL